MKKVYLALIGALIFLIGNPLWAAKGETPPKDLGQKVITRLWTRALKSSPSKKRYFPEVAAPYTSDGKVFVGTHSSYFYAIEEGRGKILWKFKSNGPIACQPMTHGNRVFFGNNKGTVYALDQNTGELQWDYFVGGEVLAQPALVGNSLYVVTTSREVYSIDASSGTQKWTTYVKGFEKKFTMRGNSPIVAVGDKLYIGFADGQVVSLSAQTGALHWSSNLARGNVTFKDIDAAIIVDNASLFVVGYFGYLVKLNRASGQVVWRKEMESGANMALDASYLYLSTTDGRVVALDKASGLRRWDVSLHSGVLSPPAILGDLIVVGAERGRGYIFNKSDGKLLQVIPLASGQWGPGSSDDSRLYLLSGGGKLYALGRSSPASKPSPDEDQEPNQ